MKAAIYARFSTDLQRDESIDDQVRVCRKFLKNEHISDVNIFADKGVSGSKANRPDYQALLTAARNDEIDIIVCEDVSRLWRDEAEQARCVKELQYLEKPIIGVNDGIDTRREGFEYLLAIRGAMNAGQRRDIAKRTHRGLTGVAETGRSAGGKVYGYKSIYDTGIDKKGRPEMKAVGRDIVPEQAKWVLQIFEWFADDHSPRWIANELNSLGVPPPGASWNRKSQRQRIWQGSAIYGDMTKGTGILNNVLYIGRSVWNRSKWIEKPDGSGRERRERPESEWITVEVPELRIVPQALWERVKARQAATRKKSERLRKALHDNARTGAGPKYLFSGLLECGCCGAKYTIISAYQYGCASHTNGGRNACANKVKVPRELVEAKLLKAIKNDLYSNEAFEIFRKETSHLLREAQKQQRPDTKALDHEHRRLEGEIENMVAAIAAGTFSPTLKARIKEAEQKKEKIEVQLNANTDSLAKIPDILPKTLDRYKSLVANLEKTVLHDVAKARTLIKQLLGDTVRLTPEGEHLVAELIGNPESFFLN